MLIGNEANVVVDCDDNEPSLRKRTQPIIHTHHSRYHGNRLLMLKMIVVFTCVRLRLLVKER
jgi:hypothetical protein